MKETSLVGEKGAKAENCGGSHKRCGQERADCLKHQLANFFCKGPVSKHFRVCGPYGLTATTHPCCCTSGESSQRQCVNDYVWLYSNKMLFMDAEI